MRRRVKVAVAGTLAIAVLAVLAAIGVPVALGLLPANAVRIFPFEQCIGGPCPTEYTIQQGQVAVIKHGWLAANKGLVKLFWKSLEQEFVLTRDDGWTVTLGTEEARQYLTPIETTPDPGDFCAGKDAAASSLEYYLWNLDPGTYTLESRAWLKHKITDGCDSVDGDGRPDQFEGERFHTFRTIIVQ